MMEVFLLPWTLAQYIFSLGVWVFAISFIRQTDTSRDNTLNKIRLLIPDLEPIFIGSLKDRSRHRRLVDRFCTRVAATFNRTSM